MVSKHLGILQESPEFVQMILELPEARKLMIEAEMKEAVVKSIIGDIKANSSLKRQLQQYTQQP